MTTTITDGTEVSTVLRTNLATDPRGTDAARWFGSFGTGGAGTETMISGASDGPVLPDGTRPGTYVRYTFTTANTGGNAIFGYNSLVPASNVYPSGTKAGLAIYARASRGSTGALRLYGRGLTAANTQTDSSYSPSFADAPAGQWVRLGMVHEVSSAVGAWLPYAQFLAVRFSVGDTVDVVCALIDPDATEVGAYFDGDSPAVPQADGTTLSYAWTGAPNASSSVEIETVPRTSTPDLVLSNVQEAEARTLAHVTLNGAAPDVTLRPVSSRAGAHRLFFLDRADAQDAYLMHREGSVFTLTDDANPFNDMSYVVQGGRLTIEEIVEYGRWVVTVPYAEVTP